jgi:uncharacterized protein YbbC (DUF1343 family)
VVRGLAALVAITVMNALAVGQVMPGIDVLREDQFQALQGKRVGLVANPASIDSRLVPTVDVLHQAQQVNLVALYGPEHGVYGDEYAGDRVEDRTDPRTGLPVYSLYGATRKPTPEMLAEIDVLVFDLQDIGSRSYTYISTMKVCLEACVENEKEFMILDRPNPLGGVRIEGPMLREGFESFIGLLYVPYIHGMTMGELARQVRDEVAPEYEGLTVIPMKGWRREMVWEETGLEWVPTSPHIPQASSVAAYAATGIIGELGVLSNGVGYTLPFEIVGAPWVNGDVLADAMNTYWGRPRQFYRAAIQGEPIPMILMPPPEGVRFRSKRFRPFYAIFQGEHCQGVQVHINPKTAGTLVEINFRLLEALDAPRLLAESQRRHDMFDKACGSDEPRRWLSEGRPLEELFNAWRRECEQFREQRRQYLLY